MSYAIGEVIYGVDISPDEYGEAPFVQYFQHEDTKYAYEDCPSCVGIHTSYTSSGPQLLFLGVELLGLIDECNTVDLQNLIESLPDQQVLDFRWQKYLEEELDLDAYQAIVKVHGELKPRLLIVWSSS